MNGIGKSLASAGTLPEGGDKQIAPVLSGHDPTYAFIGFGRVFEPLDKGPFGRA